MRKTVVHKHLRRGRSVCAHFRSVKNPWVQDPKRMVSYPYIGEDDGDEFIAYDIPEYWREEVPIVKYGSITYPQKLRLSHEGTIHPNEVPVQEGLPFEKKIIDYYRRKKK